MSKATKEEEQAGALNMNIIKYILEISSLLIPYMLNIFTFVCVYLNIVNTKYFVFLAQYYRYTFSIITFFLICMCLYINSLDISTQLHTYIYIDQLTIS